jgi:hypothetical protein
MLDPAALLALHATAGNAAVAALLQGATVQRDADHPAPVPVVTAAPTSAPAPTTAPASAPAPKPKPITPKSIGEALAEVKTESVGIVDQVAPLPWEVFKYLPNNPLDRGKQDYYPRLRAAWTAIGDAGKTAEQTEKALAKVTVTKESATGHKAFQKAFRAERAAAKALKDARADFVKASDLIKAYIKKHLGGSSYPDLLVLRQEGDVLRHALHKANAALAKEKSRKASKGKGKAGVQEAAPAVDPVANAEAAVVDAQARLDDQQTRLADKLADIETDIDAADFAPKATVHQNRYHITVGDAKVTLTDHAIAYSTVVTTGFQGLAKKPPAAGVGPAPSVNSIIDASSLSASVKKIVKVIASFETGRASFTATDTYDIADVTWGIVQWTTGTDGAGDLIDALLDIKRLEKDAFTERFARFGIDVEAGGLVVTRSDGSTLKGKEAAKLIQADPQLAAVMAAAGTDPNIVVAELTAAYDTEVKPVLDRKVPITFTYPLPKALPPFMLGEPMVLKPTEPPPKHRLLGKELMLKSTISVRIGHLVTSELGVGVLTNKTVHAGAPVKQVRKAANRVAQEKQLAPTESAASLSAEIEPAVRQAIWSKDDAKRIKAMEDYPLSKEPMSFTG